MIALLVVLFLNSWAISLQEAVETALKTNNILKAKKLEVKEKEIELKISKLRLLPRIDLFADYNKTTDPPYAIMNRMESKKLPMVIDFNDPGKYQLFRTGARAFVPIWLGGKLRVASSIKKKEVEAERENFERTRQKIILDVIKAYYDALKAKAFVETAQLALKDARRHLKDVETYYKAGLVVRSDYLQAKVFEKEMEKNLVKAKANYEVAKRALLLTMGLPPNREIEIDGDLAFKDYSFSLDELIQTALASRPELKEVKARVEQARQLKKLAMTDFLPQFSAFGEYFYASNTAFLDRENTSWTVGFQMNINLFSGGIRFKEIEKAKTVKSRTLEMKEQVKKGIMFEVSRAYYFLLEAKKRIELAESSRKSAEEALRIVEKRYKNGISTITELLDAQTFLNKARTEYVSALADYKKAVAELFFAVGIIDKRYQTLE